MKRRFPTGVITAAYYTELNINAAVLRQLKLGNMRGIQGMGLGDTGKSLA